MQYLKTILIILALLPGLSAPAFSASWFGGVNRAQLENKSAREGFGADMIGQGLRDVSTLTELISINPESTQPKIIYLQERGGGVFVWNSSDLSSAVTADTMQGVYVAPASDTSGSSGAWVRKDASQLNIIWFGAISADGLSDSASIQAAYNFAISEDYNSIYLPAGRWLVSDPVRTFDEKDALSQSNSTGITFFGDGKATILTANDSGAADYSDYSIRSENVIFGVHSSNNTFRDMQFIDARTGIYIGQDPREPTNSDDLTHAHDNKFSRLFFEKVGTAILLEPGYGNYYNIFEDIRIIYCQIGIHFDLPPYDYNSSVSVSNRNIIRGINVNNSWIGVLVDNGDSGVLTQSNFESMKSDTTYFTAPDQLHDGVATAIYADDSAHVYGIGDWKLSALHFEANDKDLYYDARGWGFLNVQIGLDTRVEVATGAIIGNFISNGSPYSSYKWAGFHIGPLHVKEATTTIDPFLPEISATENGVMIDKGLLADISAAGKLLDFETIDLTGNSDISSVSAGLTVTKTIGGIHDWWGYVTFEKNSELGTDDALRLKLPESGQIDTVFNNLKVPAYVQSNLSPRELTEATFITGTNYIDIKAPGGGWDDEGLNKIHFHFRWFDL